MDKDINEIIHKNLELMREILKLNMEINYETYCEALSKVDLMAYMLMKYNK